MKDIVTQKAKITARGYKHVPKNPLIALLLIILMQFIFLPLPKAYAYSNPAAVDLLTVSNFAALAKTLISSGKPDHYNSSEMRRVGY